VESAPEDGFYCPTCGWRIALDPAHGMMPVEIEFFRKTMQTPIRRIYITKFHEVEPGVWAPAKATHECLDWKNGRVMAEIHLAVDMERSQWNQPVAEKVFDLPIPEGTRVTIDADMFPAK
jgi:hypothetical protein